jgi:hypothetical protein
LFQWSEACRRIARPGRLLAAFLLLAAQPACAGAPPPGRDSCRTKQQDLSPVAVMGGGFPADLGGDMEMNLALNLLHFEAVDVIGRDLVVIFYPGATHGRIAVYRDGCHERDIWRPNLYLRKLLKIRKEEGA